MRHKVEKGFKKMIFHFSEWESVKEWTSLLKTRMSPWQEDWWLPPRCLISSSAHWNVEISSVGRPWLGDRGRSEFVCRRADAGAAWLKPVMQHIIRERWITGAGLRCITSHSCPAAGGWGLACWLKAACGPLWLLHIQIKREAAGRCHTQHMTRTRPFICWSRLLDISVITCTCHEHKPKKKKNVTVFHDLMLV